MKKSIVEMILEFIRQVRRSKRWQRAVTCVAALVVFVTTYALILPAITLEGNHPRLASEKLSGWAGDPMSVTVSAESPAGSGEKVVVLTAESVSAGLSEEYEFDAEGVTVFEDKMGQEIRLHRTVRENTEDTVDYWFVLAAGQKTEFTLDLQDEIVVDDVIASAGIVENVRTNKKEEAEKASPSDAVKVEETEAAAVAEEATASNAVKTSVTKATVSNAAKASASNADVEDEEEVDTDEETGEILDGAVINDLDVSDIDQETEITATLKLNAGMGDELAEAIRDAEKNADKRGNASLEYRWKMIVNTTQELEWSDKGVTVHMYYNAAAKIPEGAHLSVAEIPEGSEEYQAYLASAEGAVKAKKATGSNAASEKDAFIGVSYARFFDITILDEEENEIQPASQVVVKISYDEAAEISEEAEVKTVHFPSAGGTEVIDAVVEGDSTNLDGVAFNATGFSVYGVVGTEKLAAQVITAEGETYTIEVTCGPEAQIPVGAELRVREIEQGSDEFFKYYNETIQQLGVAPIKVIDQVSFAVDFETVHKLIPEVPQARYFDISIISNGNKIEPQAAVGVKIIYDDAISIQNENEIKAVHFAGAEDVDIKSASTEIENHKTEITFAQNGFSITGAVEASLDRKGGPTGEENNTAFFAPLRAVTDENKGPKTTKTVRDNGNGTHTIRLDILGEVETQTETTKANVIVILDTSGSMNQSAGYSTRWAQAKAAVNTVASTLLGKNNPDRISGNDDDDIVEMALVTFDTSASTNVSSATSATTISNALNRIDPSGGTNWEDALQEAAGVNFNNDGDPTYVIFISDGNPTFRNTSGNYGYLPMYDNNQWHDIWGNATNYYYTYRGDRLSNYTQYGLGSDDPNNRNYSATSMARCYDHAVDDAEAIVASGRQFYGIGVYGNASWVSNLVTDSGAPSDHYYNAADSAALAEALKDIADAITSNLGFSNVSTSDGITALSSISAKVVDGHATGFRYYKNGTIWADAPEATPTEDGITWDLSSENPLADKTTYSIEFDIWPSQEAYDTVADLNNGLTTYDALEQKVKDQINDNGDGTYSLKTNTSLTTTYTKDGVTATDEWEKGNSAMSLDVRTFKVKKLWNNNLDDRDTSKVELIVTKDGQNYLDEDNIIELTKDQEGNMISDDIFISCGFITHETNGYDVKELGHEYSIKEPENYSYYWDLKAAVYRPMVIDGTPHMLVKTDSPTGTEGTDYYVIEGNKYQVGGSETILEATNDRRSYLNLSKTVTDDSVDQSADPDALFKYTLTIGKQGEDDIWFRAQDGSGATQTISEHSSNVSEEVKDGLPTGYYYVSAGSEFTISIKNGWNVRFTNLPTGTTYVIQESDMPEGFEFVNAESSAEGDEEAVPATISGQSANGTINKANTDYSVAYTNKWVTKEITIVKVDENQKEISDAAFTITTGDPESLVSEFVSDSTDKDSEGADILGNKFKLPYGIYCLTETSAPNGYIILKNKIYFKVDAANGLITCDKDGNSTTYEKVSVSAADLTLTVENIPGTPLPHTGGRGTLPFRIAGLALMLMGAAYVSYDFETRRRRERRLKK